MVEKFPILGYNVSILVLYMTFYIYKVSASYERRMIMEKTMEKIVALAKSRGFVYPGSEIYGGLANTWDYGNLGVELKNNVKKAWWQKFIMENPYNVGVDCAILMNPQTWVASGHLGGFSDPLMDCKECHERFRDSMEQERVKIADLDAYFADKFTW